MSLLLCHVRYVYSLCVPILWAESSGKHGVPKSDALHAINNAAYSEEDFDDGRHSSRFGYPTLFVGPQRRRSDPYLEILCSIDPATSTIFVFHVMAASAENLMRAGLWK